MRPERKRGRSLQTGVSRARMYLKANLAWLDGFPVAQSADAVVWSPRPRVTSTSSATVRIDRETLRKAQFTLNKLTHRFPRAMPTIVGDVAHWEGRVIALLDRLKSAVHEGSDILEEQAVPVETLQSATAERLRRIKANFPALRPLLNAVVWAGMVRREPCEELIHWVEANARWLTQHLRICGPQAGMVNLLLLGDLVRQDGDAVADVFRPVLEDTRCFSVPAEGYGRQIRRLAECFRQWKDQSIIPDIPVRSEMSPGAAAVELLHWLARQDAKTRGRSERLARHLINVDGITVWESAWNDLEQEFRTLRRQVRKSAHKDGPKVFRSTAKRAALRIEEKREHSPPELWPQKTVASLQQAGLKGSAEFTDAMCGVLSHIRSETDAALKRAVFDDAVRRLTDTVSQRRLVRFLQLVGERMRAAPDAIWHRILWKEAAERWTHGAGVPVWSSPYRDLLSNLPDSGRWPVYLDSLAELADCLDETLIDVTVIAWLVTHLNTTEATVKRYRQLADTGRLDRVNVEELTTALQLETSVTSFRELASVLFDGSWPAEGTLMQIRRLHSRFQQHGWEDVVPTLLVAGGVKRFERTIPRMMILTTLLRESSSSGHPDGAQPGQIPVREACGLSDQQVASHYPDALKPLIVELSAVSDQGQKNAVRILAKDFPDPQSVEREISVLRESLAENPNDTNRSARLNNLLMRRDNPRAVSAKRIERLKRKLFAAVQERVFQRFTDSLEAQLGEFSAGSTSVAPLPREVFVPPNTDLLAGILELNEPYRSLGLRLFRRSLGLLCWEPNEEPANQHFLERLRSMGVTPDAWLQPFPPQTVQHPKTEEPIRLEFAGNDRDTLLMGFHFRTCLSPRSFNFFSAVVNAADVNKRVLYARDAGGRVIARCLLAIGDSGSLVAFNPYCHDSELPFADHVAAVCAELALSMGTVVSHTDQVSPLMAGDWYDDGAYDVSVAVTAPSSPLHAAVREATEDTIIQRLENVFAPLELNERTLPFAVSLHAFGERPELVRPLLPLLDQLEHLPVDIRMRAACLAFRAGCHEFACPRILREAPDYLMRQRRMEYVDPVRQESDVMQALLEYSPTQLLRVLRRTRLKSVSSDEEERDKGRRRLLAQIHERLGRVELASRMRIPVA